MYSYCPSAKQNAAAACTASHAGTQSAWVARGLACQRCEASAILSTCALTRCTFLSSRASADITRGERICQPVQHLSAQVPVWPQLALSPIHGMHAAHQSAFRHPAAKSNNPREVSFRPDLAAPGAAQTSGRGLIPPERPRPWRGTRPWRIHRRGRSRNGTFSPFHSMHLPLAATPARKRVAKAAGDRSARPHLSPIPFLLPSGARLPRSEDLCAGCHASPDRACTGRSQLS